MAKKKTGSVLDGGLSNKIVEAIKKRVHSGAPLPKGRGGAAPLPRGRKKKKQPEVLVAPEKPKRKRVFDDIEVKVYNGKGAMTVEQAMQEIGWTVVDEGQFFHLKDPNGSRILLANCPTNRPFRIGLANRYKSEYLRNKWKLNGETLIFDWFGFAQSCQHRLAGFIMAEIERKLNKKPRKDGLGWGDLCKTYWGRGGPLTFECITVKGINPAREVIDTLDLGLKRTIGDVFYGDERFRGPAAFVGKDNGKGIPTPPMSESVRRKLCNVLANATRLVWLRAGGKSVADAPHFPHSEALDFIATHERLEESVLYIWGLEGGSGKGGKKISSYLSLGYAAGLHYLMMTSGTDPDEYTQSKEGALDFKMEKKAKEFWAKMASGADMKSDHPILIARNMLPSIDAGGALGRDEIVGVIINAFNFFSDGKTAEVKDIALKRGTNKVGKPMLTTDPRLGGLDVEGRENLEPPDVTEVEDTREATRQVDGQWSEGDTCWVYQDDGEHWFGTIVEIFKRPLKDGGSSAMVEDVDTGRQWDTPFKELWLKKPA